MNAPHVNHRLITAFTDLDTTYQIATLRLNSSSIQAGRAPAPARHEAVIQLIRPCDRRDPRICCLCYHHGALEAWPPRRSLMISYSSAAILRWLERYALPVIILSCYAYWRCNVKAPVDVEPALARLVGNTRSPPESTPLRKHPTHIQVSSWSTRLSKRGSQALFDTSGSTWCGSGCGKCYKVSNFVSLTTTPVSHNLSNIPLS